MPMTQEQFEQKLTQLIKKLINISQNKKKLVLTFQSKETIDEWVGNYIELASSVKKIEELIGKYNGYKWFRKVPGSSDYTSLNYSAAYGRATLFRNLSGLGMRMAYYLQIFNGLDKKEAWIDVLTPTWKNVLQLVVDITYGAKNVWDKNNWYKGNDYLCIQPLFDIVKKVGINVKD